MSGQEALLDWDAGSARLFPAVAAESEPDVVDSWFVDDGWARAVELHAARFSAACSRRHGLSPRATGVFLKAVMRTIPRTGRWFPRVELTPDLRLRLRLRCAPQCAPARSPTVRLWVNDGVDPRTEPGIKGPDLPALHALRARARHAGADEALLLGPDGTILEGAFSAILWWRGDTLCTTPREAAVLDSVTRRLLVRTAADSGHDIVLETATPADLDGLEVWSAGALHGVRAVSGWIGQSLRPAAATRAEDWNARLELALRPLR